MTLYAASYDLEHPELCIPAAAKLVEVHRRHNMPATFFCVASVAEKHPARLQAIFGNDPLIDVQSHTYYHRMLRDHLVHGRAIPVDELWVEVGKAADRLGEIFGTRPVGMRSGCGFEHGMKGEPERLKVIDECGMKYISTQLRGPYETIPAPFVDAYAYADDGFPHLWEFPTAGWHDNVLKGYTAHPTMFPGIYPFALPPGPVTNAREDFEAAKPWVEYAVEQGKAYIGLCYHPWSLYTLDPECGTIDLLLAHAKSLGLEGVSYTELWRRAKGGLL